MDDPERCPNENTIAGLMQGLLDKSSVERVEAHVDRCPECAQLMAALGRQFASENSGRNALRLGRYQLGTRLGDGGMSEIFAAYDPQLGREVAIKLLRPGVEHGSDAKIARARLLREARALAALSHPNVLAVHDIGEVDERVFLAVELVEGKTVGDWLTAQKPGWREVIAIFEQAGRGLAAAHAHGLVHRDVKPSNILVGDDGRVRITDFGLVTGDADDVTAGLTLTSSGVILGTPAYMAPEQYHTAAVDVRADQFSFCVALYEALYGKRPFTGATPAEVAQAVLSGKIEPANSEVPAAVFTVLAQGLQVSPEARHASMDALLSALAQVGSPQRRRWPVVVAVAVAAAIAVIPSMVVIARHPGTDTAARTAVDATAIAAVATAGTANTEIGSGIAVAPDAAVHADTDVDRAPIALDAGVSAANHHARTAILRRDNQSEVAVPDSGLATAPVVAARAGIDVCGPTASDAMVPATKRLARAQALRICAEAAIEKRDGLRCLDLLERVERLDPNHHTTGFLRGQCLMLAGDCESGKAELRRFLAPNNTTAEMARRVAAIERKYCHTDQDSWSERFNRLRFRIANANVNADGPRCRKLVRDFNLFLSDNEQPSAIACNQLAWILARCIAVSEGCDHGIKILRELLTNAGLIDHYKHYVNSPLLKELCRSTPKP